MDKQTKRLLAVTALGICLYVALMNLSAVLAFLGKMVGLISSVIAGAILALFIHVPMNGIKKRLLRFFQARGSRLSGKAVHVLSFVCTLACMLLILALVLVLLIPEIIASSQSLYLQVMERLELLQSQDFDIAWMEEAFSKIDLESITQKLSEGVDTLLSNVVDALSSTIGAVVTACFAIIVCIYISLGKEKLARHCCKLVMAYLPEKWAQRVLRCCSLFAQTFSKFLSGQCTEAVILGTLMFLAFTVFKLPYASLVGVLTAVCAIIPYVGSYVSAAVSVLLTVFIAPELVIRCLIVYMSVQFIENQFIYPRVVGGSVGLPPLYTLIATMIGGKLFGIIGILFFIPLAAVILELVKEDANSRINKKELQNEKA